MYTDCEGYYKTYKNWTSYITDIFTIIIILMAIFRVYLSQPTNAAGIFYTQLAAILLF